MKTIFSSCFQHMDVLCVHHYLNHLLAGIGDSIYIYNKEKLQLKKQIFIGEKVHSISSHGDIIIATGIKKLAFLYLVDYPLTLELKHTLETTDWIQDVILLKKNFSFAFVSAHNVFHCYDTIKEISTLKTFQCEEKCILYCGKILGNDLKNTVVFGGTVFNEVILWIPFDVDNSNRPVIHRLKGHKGVIFSITVDTKSRKICTTSDDRSICIWNIVVPDYGGPIIKKQHWINSSISLQHVLFGHTARVWKSLIFSDTFLSVGEDSRLCFWTKEGKLDRSHSLFQGSGIRGFNHSEIEGIVTTGGEDGSIISLPFLRIKSEISSTTMQILDDICCPSRVVFLKSQVAMISDKGSLFINDSRNLLELIYENKSFVNYCLLEVSPCKDYLALASLHGRLVVLNVSTKSEVLNQLLINGKIFSMHWLESVIVTCGPNGVLELWEINDFLSLIKMKEIILPNSKERWSTCALICEDVLLVGDRMGSIFSYFLKGDSKSPMQSFPRIHGHSGVTNVIKVKDSIFTTGRDGFLKEFILKDVHLTYMLNRKMPMEWIWKIVPYENDQIILGFSGNFFLVWSSKSRETFFKFSCGGGHRSCDYKIFGNILSFVYIKDKLVHTLEILLNPFLIRRNGYHAKEINCLKILKLNPPLFISGSEDTTLRINQIENNDIESLYILDNHISSVRTLAICTFSENKRMIVSGGGRAQICIYEFDMSSLKCNEVALERFRNCDKSWKSLEPSLDPETRIMCLDCLKINSGHFLVVAGCSDCEIRFFILGEKIKHFKSVQYTHCVLKISFLVFEENYLILTMATDGRIVFWDVTELVNSSENTENSFISQKTYILMHQSGINSFDFKRLNDDLLVLTTGGDDNLISMMILKLDIYDDLKISTLSVWRSSQAHSCQITGLKIISDYLMSTSIDQRITLWHWKLEKEEVVVSFMDQCISAVPDIQGLDICQVDEKNLKVIVYGKGLEVFDVTLPDTV